MKEAKVAFVWCLVALSFIAGTMLGAFEIGHDPRMWVVMILPGGIAFFSAMCGLIEVFEAKS